MRMLTALLMWLCSGVIQ